MAGRGPAPKPANRRARTNSDPSLTVIPFRRGEQPPLPEDATDWTDQTRRWWAMWADSELAERFISSDWSFLLDTALLHTAVWSGELDKLPELRIRVAKFGATPEDRARLRIQFAEADQAEARNTASGVAARNRRGPLKAAN